MFPSQPNELTKMVRHFLQPQNATHRQYEALRAFFVAAHREFGKTFFFEDLGDGNGTQIFLFGLEGSADIINGEVLFS